MATGYVRQSSGLITTGLTIEASHHNNEYNAIESAMNATTGHNHDGTTGGGAPLAVAALGALTNTSAGVIVADGADNFTVRTIVAPAAGITVTNGNGVSGNPTLALANDLAALEALSSTGMLTRTGSETYALRTLTAGSDISITNGDGVSGNPTIAVTGIGSTIQGYDATLNALASYNTNGLLTQTAADTFTGRTLTGTSNRISVTNGNGVSGNPTVDISSSYVGQTSITTLGTIGTGTWQGTTVGISYGGTGQTTANGAFNALAPSQATHAGKFLTTDGTNTSWATVANFGDPGANGVVVRTSLNTSTARTITGTSNEITVTNGDGVSGNPTISIPSAVTFTGKTVTGGTFNSITIGSASTGTTQTQGDNSTKLATTAYVDTAVGAVKQSPIIAWGRFDGTGANGAKSLVSGTGATINKTATGTYTVTFSTARAASTYTAMAQGNDNTLATYNPGFTRGFSTSSFVIEIRNFGSGALTDVDAVCFTVME